MTTSHQKSGPAPHALADALLLASLVVGIAFILSVVFGLAGQRFAILYCVNLCAVLAFQMFSGNSGIISFGHTAFMGIGAYVSAWLTMPAALQRTTLPNLPAFLAGHEWPLIASLGAVLLVGLAAGYVSGLPIARLNGASASIATLGFLIIIYTVLAAARDFTRGNQAFYGVPRSTGIITAVAAAVVFVVLARLFRESRTGLMLRASRDNETAAVASGVDARRMRFRAWILSGAAAAVAGALYGHMLGAFTPKDFYFHLAFGYVAMMIVGGLGTVTGAAAGVGLIMMIAELLQKLEGGFTLAGLTVPPVFGLPIVGMSLTILAVLWFRPAGLFGLRELGLRRASPGAAPAAAVAVKMPGQQTLAVSRARKTFAGLIAIDDVSGEIETGRITGLIGPNGAGKSTLVNAITGLDGLSGGTVSLDGRRIDRLAAFRVARAGIARTFQNIRLFESLTAEENVMVAAIAAGQSLGAARQTAAAELSYIGLAARARETAGGLPYGARRRLEIARALAARPAFLLLDEPAAGMNPEETADLARRLQALPDERGLGILLIDHDLKFIVSLCDRIMVLNRGQKIADASPSRVQADPRVIEAYIGARASRAPKTGPAEAVPQNATTEN